MGHRQTVVGTQAVIAGMIGGARVEFANIRAFSARDFQEARVAMRQSGQCNARPIRKRNHRV